MKKQNSLTPDKFSFHPKRDPQDGRSQNGDNLTKRKKGDPGLPGAGRPKRTTVQEDLISRLEKKIESDYERRLVDGVEVKKKVTLKQEVLNVYANAVLGKIHLSPTQVVVLKDLLDRDGGKSVQRVEVEGGQPLLVFDLDLSV